MKRFLYILLAAMLVITALSVAVSAADAAFIGYNKGNNANDGLSASAAKKSLGGAAGNGAFSLVKDGGILVVSEKLYVGDNYTWDADGAVTITANYGGKDYKNPAPAVNPASGVIKIKPSCTLTVASDLIFDDIIFFQEGQQNTILVKSGATLTVKDTVVSMSSSGHYPSVIVEKGAKAIVEGGIYDSITGEGNITLGDKVAISSTVPAPVTQGNIAYIAYTGGSNQNNGLSDTAPKQTLGTTDSSGVAGLLKKGGTMIVSGKLYIGNDYAWCVNGNTTITANYGGKDYKNPEPASNPASGVIKMKPGATLTIASNVTLDDVILFQENAQCTIIVSGGATLTVNESVITMSNREHFMKIIVTEGSTAILNGGTFSSVSGPGTIKLGAKAKVLEEAPTDTEKEEAIKREVTVCYLDYTNGKNTNDGKSAEKAVKSYGDGVFKKILVGGTVVLSGNSYIGGSGAANTYSMPVLAKPLTFTSVYGGKNYMEKATFHLSTNATLAIASDVTFDSIVLVQSKEGNTIHVKAGATLTVTDTVKFVTEEGATKHYNIIVDKGAMAILSEAAQKAFTVSGDGKVLPYTYGDADLFNHYLGTSTMVQLTIGSKTAYINGEAHTLDAAPINRNSRTMLPIRFLANAFGIENDGIKWDAATRTATLSNATTTIVVTIGAASMTVNGASVALDSPAVIESNRTYLPVRAIANALGVSDNNIAWDAAANTATLIK